MGGFLDIPLPTELGRKELLIKNLVGLNIDESINWDSLIKRTDGYSGAELINVINYLLFF